MDGSAKTTELQNLPPGVNLYRMTHRPGNVNPVLDRRVDHVREVAR